MPTINKIKSRVMDVIPKPALFFYRLLRYPSDIVTITNFLFDRGLKMGCRERILFLRRIFLISTYVYCAHRQKDVFPFIKTIFSLPKSIKGCVVEAGCFKGGSTAKFSVAAKMMDRRLVVFDSFSGIPEHAESHDLNIFGTAASFPKGSYCGSQEEVKKALKVYGEDSACSLVKGWFDDTLVKFSEPIAAIYLDVDLASSTRTCLKYLYPLLVSGGVLYSHDGHLPLVIDVLEDEDFWEKEVGCVKPLINGLGKQKLIKIIKTQGSNL